MLSLLKHVHDCQRSIDARSTEEERTTNVIASRPESNMRASPVQQASAKSTTQRHRTQPGDGKKRGNHQRRPQRHPIPREIRLCRESIGEISPLRNPRVKNRGHNSKKNEDGEVERIQKVPRCDEDLNQSVTEISVDDQSTVETSFSRQQTNDRERRVASSHVSRRSSVGTDQHPSESSESRSILDKLEIRSKGTMKSRPCYSEIKGHVAPTTPQQSPVRRFSVDNGQLVCGNLASSLVATATIALTKNVKPATEIKPESEQGVEKESILPGADRYLRREEPGLESPMRRAQSLVSTVKGLEIGPPSTKSPVSPSKRCSLASGNLLQCLKDTYSPRNNTRVVSGVLQAPCPLSSPDSGRKNNTANDRSYLSMSSPQKAPCIGVNKGCLPALSPGLSSPVKTRHNADILLPDSSDEFGVEAEQSTHHRRYSMFSDRCAPRSYENTGGTRRSSMGVIKPGDKQPREQKHGRRHYRRHNTDVGRTSKDAKDRTATTKHQQSVQDKQPTSTTPVRPRRQTLSHVPLEQEESIYPEKENIQRYIANELDIMHNTHPRSPRRPRRQTMSHTVGKADDAIYPEKEDLREYIAKQLGVTDWTRRPATALPEKKPRDRDNTDDSTSQSSKRRPTKCRPRNSKAA